ncbi:MAG: radical SAM protein [Conexivisphaerales archaeon]
MSASASDHFNNKHGFKIVLTGETAIMSDYGGQSLVGFASALPEGWIRGFVEQRLFPTRSDAKGRMYLAPYGVAKVEASLLNHGFTRDEVIIADPRRLSEVVGPDTRVVGITTMDPMGVSYGIGIVNLMLRAIGIKYDGLPYISRSFFDVIKSDAIRKYRPRIIVGGPASWQLVDTGAHEPLGVDCVFEGEFEKDGWKLFYNAVRGDPIPKRFHGGIPAVQEIPPIATPAIGGEVEISRGCGRGCKFCTPTLLRWLSLPYDLIEKEVRFNLEHGEKRHITLHSEEFFKYGSDNVFQPNREKVMKLLGRVDAIRKEYESKKGYDEISIATDFTTAVSVVSDPTLVKLSSEYMNPGGSFSYIEMGIETGSPRLIDIIMPGKVRPFTSKEYPSIVERAVGILNDNRWVVVGTMIMNFPGETEDDLIRSLELVDRLKPYNVLIWTLPFIPMGGLRKKGWTILEEILEHPLRKELLVRALYKTFSVLLKEVNSPTEEMRSVIDRIVWTPVSKFGFAYMMLHMRRQMSRMQLHAKNIEERKQVEAVQRI